MTKTSPGRRTRARSRRWGPALALLLTLGSLLGSAPSPAAAAPEAAASARSAGTNRDFNGDGNADLAVSSARAVHIIYGSDSGLVAAGTQNWTPAGIPVLPVASVRFGSSLTTGDFNGDRYCDLAIADDSATVDGFEEAGAIVVLYGSKAGLTATGSQYFTRNTAGGAGSAELDDRFAAAMAAADFGRGAFTDLAISSGPEGVGGAVHVLYGSTAGLTGTDSQIWSQASAGIKGAPEAGDTFGRALAAGNFNGTGPADLAIGVPQETVGRVRVAGSVQIILGSTAGLTAVGDQVWHRDSTGIKGQARPLVFFGWALTAGHFAGRASADLAVETLDDRSVSVIYGSSKGLTASGDQLWNADSSGLPTGAFGGESLLPASLTAANFGHDPDAGARDDLAIGVNGAADGGVLVLYGARSGLSASGSKLWSQARSGVPGVAVRGDQFGAALAAGHFDGGRYAALTIGSPGEPVGRVGQAGTVFVLRGTSSGLRTPGIQLWTAEDLGRPLADNLDFGRELAASGP